MTMFSFRVDEEEAADVRRWTDQLGVGRSEFLRDALHRHLVRLRSESDIERWVASPLTADEQALAEIAHWDPSEEWSDWSDQADATR
ncbi:MAG: ribbon-helix-helix protein, CopG family [Actinomycetota bacterium]|nr:ribbon-helix-helix protein, CopG family [Actinomycetota bacterium]